VNAYGILQPADLKEKVRSYGVVKTTGAAIALAKSSAGFQTRGSIQTMDRFGSETEAFSASQCQGRKMAITMLNHEGALDCEEDRPYCRDLDKDLPGIDFLQGSTDEKNQRWKAH
jgi:hypothetical protein